MREKLLKKQPTWGLRRAQGIGQKSATPATLTKVILVLLTMFLLPSAAWGQGTVTVTKTIQFNKVVNPVTSNIDNSMIPVSVSEVVGGTPYTYNSNVYIKDDNAIEQYSSSEQGGAVFKVNNDATSDMSSIIIIIPGNYPIVPTMVKLKFKYANAIGDIEDPDDDYNAIIHVCDYTTGDTPDLRYKTTVSNLDKTTNPLIFSAEGKPVTVGGETITGEGGTDREDGPKSLWIMAYLDGNPEAEEEEERTTFTITEVEITYDINESDVYGLTVAGVPVTNVNASAVLFDKENWGGDYEEVKGTVSFTPAGTNPATLTLNNANITVDGKNAIESGLGNLTVNLVGDQNVITCQGSTDCVFKGTVSGAKVTFTTDATTPGVLISYVSQESNMFVGIEPIFQNGLNFRREGDSYYIDTKVGLMIGDNAITYANIGSDGTITGISGISSGTVKFTPADNTTTPATPATLTLTNATLGGSTTDGSIESILDNLTINLEGTNTLYGHIAYTGTGATAGSLAFTGNGSLTLSNSDGVIYAFSDVDFEELFNFASISQGIHYNTSTKDLQDANEDIVSNVTIIKGTYYPIWVKGTLVTASNYSDVLDDGKVSFDPTGNKLSLDEATIDCSETSGVVPVASTIKDLKVYLSGINTIKVYHYSNKAFVYAGSESGATLTFSTVDPSDYENLGMLTIDGIGSKDNISSDYAVKGLVGETSTSIDDWGNDNYNTTDRSVSGWILEKSNGGDKYVKLSYREVYDLWISSVRYCSDNLYNNVGDAFDPKTSTLTLTSVHDSYYNRIYSGLPALTIKINNSDNELKSISFGAPNDETIGATSGTLTIKKNEESSATVNKLTLANADTDGGVISGFSSVTIEEPMGVKSPSHFTTWDASTTNAVISDEVLYDLWVMGQQVTSANASDIFGAAQSSQTVPAIFDAEESTLTLNGLQLSNSTTYPTCIESGLESLTVTLSGDNIFQKGGDVTTLYGFKAQDGKTCNITFEASGSFSFMVQTEPEYAVSGFNKVTYKDNLVAYKKDGKTYISTLRLQFGADNTDNPTAITISPVKEGVELFSHKIAYEINYAKDGMDNIAQTEYTAAIPIATISAGPCIVSAYTIDGDNTKSNATKSYYFIYSESELIIGTESTLDLRNYLLPSIAEEDNWLCDHMTDNTDIISIDSQNGIITGLADGTATVSTQIIDGNEEYRVLNYYISQLSIDVTVQDIIGKSTFASGQSYGTFYNTDQTYAYNVPEGLEAYIIKSVDEEKGEIVTEGTSVLPPSTPVLLYRTSTSGSANYVFTKVSGVEPANTELKYTATEKEAVETSKLYVLYNGQFVKVTSGTKILANHCYLDLANTSSGTRSYYDIGGSDGTTALREVRSEGVKGEKWNDGEWYTLQGRKFTTKPTKPGLYILNGKKIVVK